MSDTLIFIHGDKQIRRKFPHEPYGYKAIFDPENLEIAEISRDMHIPEGEIRILVPSVSGEDRTTLETNILRETRIYFALKTLRDSHGERILTVKFSRRPSRDSDYFCGQTRECAFSGRNVDSLASALREDSRFIIGLSLKLRGEYDEYTGELEEEIYRSSSSSRSSLESVIDLS